MKPASGAASAREAEERRWSGLMAQAQSGDADAYRLLLEGLQAFLRPYLGRLLGNSPVVEDCLQESLLAVHLARHSYDPRRPFRPWLLAVVRHRTWDVLRKADRWGRLLAPAEAGGEAVAEDGPALDAALDAARLLARLKPEFRDAIVATKLEGQSLEEAAAACGVSGSAMKSRVHRGMRNLRRLLEEEMA
jgi:RNA polymerase sigma-70 factor (ECF subfamily)